VINAATSALSFTATRLMIVGSGFGSISHHVTVDLTAAAGVSPAGVVKVVSPTELEIELVGLSSANNGALEAIVSVNGTKSAQTQAATVQELLPQVFTAAPHEGPIEGQTIVTISGQNFQSYSNGKLLCVWGTEETNATVQDNTHITCPTSRHEAGNASVQIRPAHSAQTILVPNTEFLFYQTVFIADSNANRILRFRLNTGEFVDEFVSSSAGGLNNPSGMAFGLDQSFYVASAGSSSVLQFHGQTGSFIKTFCTVQGVPRGLVFHHEDLYVCDARKGIVRRFNGLTGSPNGI
jgi:hypothetical protein